MQGRLRKLHYFKCRQCRKDRQKVSSFLTSRIVYRQYPLTVAQCIPTHRSWPGRRCDRCIRFDYPCSASTTTGGVSQDDCNSLEEKQQAQLNDGRHDNSNGSEYGLDHPAVSLSRICSTIDHGEELLSSLKFRAEIPSTMCKNSSGYSMQ